MKIDVKVITGAPKNSLKLDGESWKLYIKAFPVDGQANAAVVDFLAGHFGVSKSQIEIIKGLKSKRKTINILTH